MLDLIHPMYQRTASYGHFGRKPVAKANYNYETLENGTQGQAQDRPVRGLPVGEDRPRRGPAQGREDQVAPRRTRVTCINGLSMGSPFALAQMHTGQTA